jgi:peptide/nickel transport system permease protein
MTRYTILRLLQTLPVLLGVSIVVFFLVRLIPGDPAVAALGSRATPQLIARVRDQLGLDLPIWKQYFNFLSNALRGDFGISFFYQQDVWRVTVERLPVTLALMGYAIAIAVLIAVPCAFLAAARRGQMTDHAIRILFTIGLGMPVFWSGIILAYVFGVKFQLLPITGQGSGGLDTLKYLTLPALTLAISISPILVRTLRSSITEVLASDYVTTGRAMGLRPRYLNISYVLRNSLRPVVTVVTINLGYLIGGTVIVEQIFSLAGVGSLLIGSIATRDYAVIQLATLIFALLVVVTNLVGDLLYILLDPRMALHG